MIRNCVMIRNGLTVISIMIFPFVDSCQHEGLVMRGARLVPATTPLILPGLLLKFDWENSELLIKTARQRNNHLSTQLTVWDLSYAGGTR
jgi:hypothetical protein